MELFFSRRERPAVSLHFDGDDPPTPQHEQVRKAGYTPGADRRAVLDDAAGDGAEGPRDGFVVVVPAGEAAVVHGILACILRHPRADVNAAWESYAATRGRPAAEQEAARRRYDAAVVRYEKATALSGITSQRDRSEHMRRMMQPLKRPLVRRDAWGYPLDEDGAN